MIIVKVNPGDKIERVLKQLKRKFDKIGVVKELRKRQAFEKPSEVRRAQISKAIYIQQKRNEEENNN